MCGHGGSSRSPGRRGCGRNCGYASSSKPGWRFPFTARYVIIPLSIKWRQNDMPSKRTPRQPLTCIVCGKTVMLPPSVIAQGRRCCSAKCQGISKQNRIETTCLGCGKVYMEKASVVARGRKYCTVACRREHEKPRIICEVCGKERRVTPSVLAMGARFCSWKCARTVVHKPVERVVVVCEQCGKECPVLPSRAKQGNGMRFCSHSCRTIWNLTHGEIQSPTTQSRSQCTTC